MVLSLVGEEEVLEAWDVEKGVIFRLKDLEERELDVNPVWGGGS